MSPGEASSSSQPPAGSPVPEGAAASPGGPVLAPLLSLAREVTGALVEGGDLNRAIAALLAGAGGHLRAGTGLLARLRGDRRALFVTHRWAARDGDVAPVESPPVDVLPDEPWLATLAEGQPLALADVRAEAGEDAGLVRLLGPSARAALVLPVLVRGRLESLLAFAAEGDPRRWDEEEVAHPALLADILARAIERRVLDRERTAVAAELEEALRRERLASHHKSEFVARMSHELRTPLNAILGYAELLTRAQGDLATRDGWTAGLRTGAQHLLGLVDDLLDLSKIEEGRIEYEPEPTALVPLVREVEEMMRVRAERKLLELSIRYEGPIPLEIETDPVRLRQILVNLVGNAIQYTPRGSVVVRVSVGAGAEGERRRLSIEVSDTGVGIALEHQERIFEAFEQVRDGSHGEGTGLGLVISRRLARLLGGDLSVRSELGRGSTFALSVPVRASLEVAAPEDVPRLVAVGDAFPSLEGQCFLVVDDNAQNRDVLTFLLGETGARVECVPSGARALESLRRAQRAGRLPDAVLMDVRMPGLDGYATTAALRAEGIELPVLALTASATDDERRRAHEAGCTDFLTKPIVPGRLFALLARHARTASLPVSSAAASSASPAFRDLVRRYVGAFPALVAELQALFREGRLTELRTRVHQLRGTAGNYGFPGITRAAAECEDALRAGERAGVVGARLERLLGLLAQARAA